MAEEFMIVLTGATGEVRLYNLSGAALTWAQVAALARALCTIPVFDPAPAAAGETTGARNGAAEDGAAKGEGAGSAGAGGKGHDRARADGGRHDRARTEGTRAVAAEVLSRPTASRRKTTVLTTLAVNAAPAPSALAAAGWELQEVARRVWPLPGAGERNE